MKRKKRSYAYILVILKPVLDILKLQIMSKKKALYANFYFKLSKGVDFKKSLGNLGIKRSSPTRSSTVRAVLVEL